jgi:hypothetical protein
MKTKLQTYFSVLLMIASISLMSSCVKTEGCTDPTAENYDPNAEIENATCIGQRKKFLGLYNAGDACNNTNIPVFQNYYIEVRQSNQTLDEILIFNLGNFYFNPVVAAVNRTTFTIERQDPDANGYYIEGDGSITGNKISIQYRIKYGSAPLHVCISNLEK